MPLIGTGFQHVIDSYFWNLPFASVRQCKYVMDNADIPEDEWTSKRAALAAEHNLPGAREQLAEGSKIWLQADMFKQHSTNRQWSWMTRCCFLPCSYCCEAIDYKALTAVPCGLMLLSIKSTKLDPKSASTDDCHK